VLAYGDELSKLNLAIVVLVSLGDELLHLFYRDIEQEGLGEEEVELGGGEMTVPIKVQLVELPPQFLRWEKRREEEERGRGERKRREEEERGRGGAGGGAVEGGGGAEKGEVGRGVNIFLTESKLTQIWEWGDQ